MRLLMPSMVDLVLAPMRFKTMPDTTSPKFSTSPFSVRRLMVTAP